MREGWVTADNSSSRNGATSVRLVVADELGLMLMAYLKGRAATGCLWRRWTPGRCRRFGRINGPGCAHPGHGAARDGMAGCSTGVGMVCVCSGQGVAVAWDAISENSPPAIRAGS